MMTLVLMTNLLSNAILGHYSSMQFRIFTSLPDTLDKFYNSTLVNHYGIHADKVGLSIIPSIITMLMTVGKVAGTLLIPIVDRTGWKFFSVHMRFILGFLSGILQILSSTLDSTELFALSFLLIGINQVIQFNITSMYLIECAPDHHRGLASISVFVCAPVVAFFTLVLVNPNIFGGVDRWFYISIITLILCTIMYITTVFLPESPKWLVRKGFMEEARISIIKYHGEHVDVDKVIKSIQLEDSLQPVNMSMGDVLKDDFIRQALILVLVFEMIGLVTFGGVELMYNILMLTTMGFSSEQSTNMLAIVSIVSIPFRMAGSVLMDKIGRRPVVLFASIILYMKVLVLLAGNSVVYLMGANWMSISCALLNEVLNEMLMTTGLIALDTLLVVELNPPAARGAVMQLILIIPLLLGIPTYAFPSLYALCQPLFYIILADIMPFMLIYFYTRLPETKGKAIYEIVTSFDEDVRSRANTRLTETTTLLSRRNTLIQKYV